MATVRRTDASRHPLSAVAPEASRRLRAGESICHLSSSFCSHPWIQKSRRVFRPSCVLLLLLTHVHVGERSYRCPRKCPKPRNCLSRPRKRRPAEQRGETCSTSETYSLCPYS